MPVISGHSSALRERAVPDSVATVQPVGLSRAAADVVTNSYAQKVADDVVETGSTTSTINATAHLARVGDIIRPSSGVLLGLEVTVVSTTANSITVGQVFPSAPSTSSTFEILRYRTPVLGSGGVPGSVGVSALTVETIIAVTGTSGTLIASNVNRRGGWVTNIGDVEIFVCFSGTATTGKPTRLAPGASIALSGPGWVYTGTVSGIVPATSANGSAEVVEL